MDSRMKMVCLVVAAWVGCLGAASAQSVVHAVGGTVASVSPSTVTMTLDDGTSSTFNVSATPNAGLDFDGPVRAETMSPEKLKADGSHVILYFIWKNDARTAVAAQSLGSGPFEKVAGTVVKFDKHDRDLTLRTADGKTEVIQVPVKAVLDTADGVGEGLQFRAGKGDHVRLLAEAKNGDEEALFVRTEGLD